MAKLIRFWRFFRMIVAIACQVNARATAADSLRLVADVSPAFVASFSQTLKEFELTEAFQKLRRKYSLVPYAGGFVS
jgi:hypothetical protein